MKHRIYILLICSLLGLSILACGTITAVPTATNPPAPTNPPPPTAALKPTSIPVTDATEPSGTSEAVLRQWAVAAAASSEYDYPDWGAIQVVGAPDTAGCGDMSTAWASETSYGVDWLELTYATPVIPTQINIYENYTPDFVTKVEVLDVNGNYLPVYNATGTSLNECPYVLEIPVTNVSEYVYGVRVTIDQTNAGYWNEIDAVELVGWGGYTGALTIPPTATTAPFVVGECEGEALPVEMNTSFELNVQAGNYPDTCEFYCLWVPENGSQLDIGISNFDIDLDLYVDTNISVLEYEDHGEWTSNAYGDEDESVSIFNPGGRYYIQVCSYEGLASTFILSNYFTP